MTAPAMDESAELEATDNEFMMARDTAEDPMKQQRLRKWPRPLWTVLKRRWQIMTAQLSAAGRGEDVQLANLRPGEVILPSEILEDAIFEATLECRRNDLDLDPERDTRADRDLRGVSSRVCRPGRWRY